MKINLKLLSDFLSKQGFQNESYRVAKILNGESKSLKPKTAYFVQDIATLKGYLKSSPSERGREVAGLAPSAFLSWLSENYPELVQNYPNWEDDPWAIDIDSFSDDIYLKYLKSNLWEDFIPDEDQPTWSCMHYKQIIRNEWLIHFTNDAWGIANSGFKYEIDDPTKLCLTTHFTLEDKKYGGFNFAFLASGRDFVLGKHYGKQAVMFKANGILIYHYGDDENQVIFHGASARDIIPLTEYNGVWQAGDFEKEFDSLPKIVKWISNNFDQYKRVLIP